MWIPNAMIFNIKSVKTVKGVREEAGLFVLNKPGREHFEIMYIILAEITFLCPMRFDSYPLDAHHCSLRFYSSYDTNSIEFAQTKFMHDSDRKSIVLEFHADVSSIPLENLQFREMDARTLNISTTGLEFYIARYRPFWPPIMAKSITLRLSSFCLQKQAEVHILALPPLRPLCGRFLGQLPHPSGNRRRKNVPADNALPCPHQHFRHY